MKIVGVDLGNSTTQASHADEHGDAQLLRDEQGEAYFPSVPFFEQSGSVLIGREAQHAALLEPERGVFNWKRALGTNRVLHASADGTVIHARDVATLLLQHVAETYTRRTNRVLSEVVIAHPHVCSQLQKEELREAAARAELSCVGLIAEPNAAALGNRLFERTRAGGEAYRVLLVDCGGGTTDCTLLEVVGSDLEVLATSGEFELGGQDFTTALMDLIAHKAGRSVAELNPHERQLLWERAEDAKRVLSARERVPLMLALNGQAVNTEVTREEFRTATRPLLERIVACARKPLEDAGLSPHDVQEVIPVGGGSCMRTLQDELHRSLGKPVSISCEPHFAVALGTLLYARLRTEEDGKVWTTSTGRVLPPARQRLRDRTAHPVGVAVVRDGVPEPDGDDDFVNCEILKKGVAIPSRQVGKFELCGRGGTTAQIVVAQGEHGALLTHCHRLGEFVLENLPPVYDRPHPITVEFTIDRDGQITAVAYSDVDPSKRANLVVDYRQGIQKQERKSA